MERRRAPDTAAGYHVLHDFRSIDWSEWTATPPADRDAMLAEAIEFLDAETQAEGDLGCFSILGHKADLLVLVFRPTMAALDGFERRFEQLDLAEFTDRSSSALGVTEASGYSEAAADFFDPDAEADPGIERYLQSRLYPTIPDVEFLSFYFMNKRRDPEYNWYDLDYDTRREHVTRHGEIGKKYAGRVTQVITGTTGFDDWEWGVTLFAEDMVAIKELLTDMRFDPSTSHFGEFGEFYTGRQFPPSDLPAFFAGESIPTEEGSDGDEAVDSTLAELGVSVDAPADAQAVVIHSDTAPDELDAALADLRGNFEHYESHLESTLRERDGESIVVSVWSTNQAADTAAGFLEELPGVTKTTQGPVGGQATTTSTAGGTASDVRTTLEAAGVYSGQPHGEDIHAVVLYSTAAEAELTSSVEQLRDGFENYDTHESTQLYAVTDGDRTAVVSLWETADAAETAADYLQELPEIERPADDSAGFTTMGMFYRVEPAHREDFIDTFADVGEALEGMDGHLETELFVNIADENDMFIASRWRAKDDAMAFFRSDAFRETVQFGREVLTGRPRHVFLV